MLTFNFRHLTVMLTFNFRHLTVSTIVFSALISLTACDSGPTQEQILANAQTLKPASEPLAEIYQRTCRNCHTIESTGAPLTGDKNAWKALITENGSEGLVNNVINGKGGMPPFGLCMECGMDEFKQLIDFMAQQ